MTFVAAARTKVLKAGAVWRKQGAAALSHVILQRACEDRWLLGRIVELSGDTARIHGSIFDLNSSFIPTKLKSRFLISSYEFEARHLIKRFLPRHLPVVELGACIGVVSCMTNRLLDHPEAHEVVEPNRNLLQLLESNRANNACHFAVRNAAVAYGKTQTPFYPDERFNEGCVDRWSDDFMTVPTVTLRQILQERGFPTVSLICDIEGAEYELVRQEGGVLRDHVAWLFLELHRYMDESGVQLQSTLKALGFELVEQFRHNFAYRNLSGTNPSGSAVSAT
jgi:FkbM family methyltransferase